jgi:hypothetical protein
MARHKQRQVCPTVYPIATVTRPPRRDTGAGRLVVRQLPS